MNNNKKRNAIILIPISMMFLILGITMFNSTKWLKFLFLIISIILSAISILSSLKNRINNKAIVKI